MQTKKCSHLLYTNLKNVLTNILLLGIFVSCQPKVQENNVLTNLIPYQQNGNQVMLFVPLDGCGTCISNSASFINKNLLELEKLEAHVYSGYNKKYLQFDSAVLKNSRFVIDSTNTVLAALNVEQKPRVIFIENGKIIEDTFFDNQNDTTVFRRILKF